MKARKEQNLILIKSDLTGADKTFRRIHSVIAWGDPTSSDTAAREHAMVTAGEMENDWFCVVGQFSGKMDALLKTAIATKDDLLVEYFHAPPEPPGLLQQLYDEDGLTRYRIKSFNRWGDPIPEVKKPQEKWATYRDSATIATVLEYQDMFLEDFESCRLIVERLTKDKKVYWLPHLVGMLEKSKNQSNAAEIPIFRAWVYVVWILWETSRNRGRSDQKQPTEWPWGDEFINQ